MFPFQTSMIIHQLVSEVGLPSYSTRKYRNKQANALFRSMETYLPIELREYAQYGAVFRIPDTFQAFLYSIKMVLDRKPTSCL
jgi:hypothetical protein